MLENTTVFQILAFLCSSAGIAFIVRIIPGWSNFPVSTQTIIITTLSMAAGVVLNTVQTFLPASILNATLADLILAVGMMALSFIIQRIDEWLAALTAKMKFESRLMQLEIGHRLAATEVSNAPTRQN